MDVREPMAGADLPGASVVAELERAELAAREKRLVAEAEAARMIEDAAVRANAIEAELPVRVAATLAALREEHLRGATEEVARIERELAGSIGGAPPGDAGTGPDAAVEYVVAMVLGEPGR
ncbi:MAG: hypothetical protein WEG56_12495 [Chloroflexota bacterium]